MSNWLMALFAFLALLVTWGEAQPNLCANDWPFPFCAGSSPRQSEATPPPPPPPPPCPEPVAISPLAIPQYPPAAAAGGGFAEVVFTVTPTGSAEVRSVSESSASYAAEAARFVQGAQWPVQWGGECRAPYLARFQVVFPAQLGADFPPAEKARDTRLDLEPEGARDESSGSVSAQPSGGVLLQPYNEDAFSRYYPRHALRDGVNGSVELSCTVLFTGALNCSVVEETPAGRRFGAVALRVAGTLRAAPALDGHPPAGETFTLPIRFRTLHARCRRAC